MARSGLAPQPTAALDGLRGMAALMVVASHASGLGMDLVPGLVLTGIGKYGVYLFFAISAFLLTDQWLRSVAARRMSPQYWGRYLLRRVMRIYPLYGVVLLVGWALAPKGIGVALDGTAVAHHLLLSEGRGIYWSVPVEFRYYLAIPFLALWLGARLPAWMRGLAVAGVLGGAMVVWPATAAPEGSITLGFYLPVFLCGSLAAWVSQKPTRAQEGRSPSGVADAVLAMLLLLSIPSVLALLGAPEDSTLLHRYFLPWGLVWAAVLWGMRRGALPHWCRLWSQPAMRACGRWCFGLYLLHVPVLYLARALPLPASLRAWCGLALALVLASWSYRWVERPMLQLVRPATED